MGWGSGPNVGGEVGPRYIIRQSNEEEIYSNKKDHWDSGKPRPPTNFFW